MSELLTVGAAGRILGVSADRVRELVRQGRLPCQRASGGLRLLRRGDVVRLAREREAKIAGRPSDLIGERE